MRFCKARRLWVKSLVMAGRWGWLLLLVLVACGRIEQRLVWLEPTQGSTITGHTLLSVRNVSDNPVSEVRFFAGEQQVAVASEKKGVFRAEFNASSVSRGQLRLRAVADTGSVSSIAVTNGSNSQGTPPTTVTPGPVEGGEDGKLSELRERYGSDPFQLSYIFGLLPKALKQPAIEALRHLPAGNPLANYYQVQRVASLGRQTVNSLGLLPQLEIEPLALPRGRYERPLNSEDWSFVDNTTDRAPLSVYYEYQSEDEKLIERVELTVEWNYDGATRVISGPFGHMEVPTSMFVLLEQTGKDLMNFEVTVAWYQEQGCDLPTLMPRFLTIDGWIGEPVENAKPVDGTPVATAAVAPTIVAQQEGGETTPPEPEETEIDPGTEIGRAGVGLKLQYLPGEDGRGQFLIASSNALITEKGYEFDPRLTIDARGPITFELCNLLDFKPDILSFFVAALIGERGPDKPRMGGTLGLQLENLWYEPESKVPSRGDIVFGAAYSINEFVGFVQHVFTEDASFAVTPGGIDFTGTAYMETNNGPRKNLGSLNDYLADMWTLYEDMYVAYAPEYSGTF